MTLFHRLFRKSAPAPQIPPARHVEMPPIRPDRLLAVIGDIHGCDRLLERLLARIAAEAPGAQVICVGDFVDRGEESAAVLRRLHAACLADPGFVCLAGNHEAMLLDFIDRPEETGARWLRYGGLQTLASFGIGGLRETASPEECRAQSAAFRAALGPELEAWLRALPLTFQSGNLAVVHAAADPDLPMSLQSRRVLQWGHEAFPQRGREDRTWIVHGHTVMPEPVMAQGRVAVDTGAYATGQLTAALISPETESLRFITA